MKIERDERKFDFHGIGLAIKRAREASGMTQEQFIINVLFDKVFISLIILRAIIAIISFLIHRYD